MTRSQEQAERFCSTPCPRPPSRKKLKRLGLSNHKAESIINQYPKKLAEAEKSLSNIVDNRDDFTVFMDMLKSVGGEYQSPNRDYSKKTHTDGKIKIGLRELQTIGESKALSVINIADGPKRANLMMEFGNTYYFDSHGSLRKIFKK